MKLNYNQILDRANVILKDRVAERYQGYPDLNISLVAVDLESSVSAMFEALIEAINQVK